MNGLIGISGVVLLLLLAGGLIGIQDRDRFNPRWLLQRPSDKALAWRDLLLLMSESD